MAKGKPVEDGGEQPDGGVGLLKIRLGACLTGPTKRMAADLHAAALACNRARTAMVRAWERWREDHPDWSPEPALRKDGSPVVWKGRPKLRNEPLPREMPEGGAPQTWLYHRGREAAPAVAAKLLASCAGEVMTGLQKETPRSHPGAAHYHWQAILSYEATGFPEAQRTCYRSPSVPVPAQDSALCYAGLLRPGLSPGVALRLHAAGDSSAVLRFPLFSRESGRDNKDVLCRIEARQLTAGNRRVLRRIASGEWPMRDSKLVYREGKRGKGAWFLHLVYKQPRVPLGLDPNRVAVLEALPADAATPFAVAGPGKTPDAPPVRWTLGWRTLEAEYRRLEVRRLALRTRYAVAGSGRKGHGRGRIEKNVRPLSRRCRDLMERFCQAVVAELLKFCRRHDYGAVVYREPTLGARRGGWFDAREIPMDWTGFLNRLAHKLDLHGIKLAVERTRREKGGAA